VLDGQGVVRELQGSTVHATHLHGARGPEYRRDSSGNVRWYLYDGLGSVLGEVDPSGTITATRKYDVYGGVRGSTGTGTSNHKFVGQLGHPSEEETGLIYMRAPYMDPVVGRFVSEDPAFDGPNWIHRTQLLLSTLSEKRPLGLQGYSQSYASCLGWAFSFGALQGSRIWMILR
jgi:RHS repeat-associated protein